MKGTSAMGKDILKFGVCRLNLFKGDLQLVVTSGGVLGQLGDAVGVALGLWGTALAWNNAGKAWQE